MMPENQTAGKKRNSVFYETGARIAKSLFFWGMTAILASSAYTDISKLSGLNRKQAVSSDAKQEAQVDVDSENSYRKAEEPGTANADMAPDLVQKKIALTFDDGPHPIYTKKLLEGLAQRHVEATFFVIGKNIPGNEELLEQMKEEGHLIGNHTYDHVKICDMSGDEACEQVEKTSSLVREITGEDTEFVRPPFGAWNQEMECAFRMIPVLWDVDPLDWTTQNTSVVVQKVVDSVKENDIILLHDCYDSSVEAALEIVDELLARGYEFVTVEELILE